MKPELTKQLNGEVERLKYAISLMRSHFEPQERIKEVLRLVMVKVGLRAANWPSDTEKDILINHVLTQYGNHTLEEIKLAFDLAITDKLDFPEGQSANCYENFSCLYFSNVMNAYRNWAKENYKQIKTEPKMMDDKKDLTIEEKQEWINEWRQKETIQLTLIPLPFYEWLNLPVAEYQKYLERSRDFCKAKLMEEGDAKKMADFVKMENEECFTGEFMTLIINTAKKMAVWENLKNK